MALYLLHLMEPLGDPSRRGCSASHYMGYSPTEESRARRIESHMNGTSGAKIPEAAHRRGIEMVVGWLGDGDRADERRMKKAGHHERRCSVCIFEGFRND